MASKSRWLTSKQVQPPEKWISWDGIHWALSQSWTEDTKCVKTWVGQIMGLWHCIYRFGIVDNYHVLYISLFLFLFAARKSSILVLYAMTSKKSWKKFFAEDRFWLCYLILLKLLQMCKVFWPDVQVEEKILLRPCSERTVGDATSASSERWVCTGTLGIHLILQLSLSFRHQNSHHL